MLAHARYNEGVHDEVRVRGEDKVQGVLQSCGLMHNLREVVIIQCAFLARERFSISRAVTYI